MTPSIRTVLAWRWGLRTIVRVAAAGLVLWTLATYGSVVAREVFARRFPGLPPFGWLAQRPGTSMQVYEIRQEFFEKLRADGALVGGAIAMWVLVGPMARWLVQIPRPLTRCPVCRYSLKGLASARCPECGLGLAGVVEPGGEAAIRPAGGSEGHPPAQSGTAGVPG